MNTTTEIITPEKAREYLDMNMVNRRVSEATVAKYADDMKNGAWQFNGEAIAFNCSGKLIDGQHRLMAIIKSGIPCTIAVNRGIDDSVSLFNLARSRSQLDSIVIDGYDTEIANKTNVAVAKLHYYMQAGMSSVSVSAIKAFFDKYNDALRVLAPIRKKGHSQSVSVRTTPIMLAMLYAIESGEDPNRVKEFADVLASGFYSSDKQTAAVVLRNDIIIGKVSSSGNSNGRCAACKCVENAIHDFCREIPRKRSYMKSTNAVYSNNAIFKEEKR